VNQKERSAVILRAIAAFKLTKAVGLLFVALGLHHLLSPDQAEIFLHWARIVRVDPDNAIFHSLVVKLTGLSQRRLEELSAGTFFYGALFATEGVGLLLKKRWAEYVTTISTTLFLPLEIYELFRRITVLKTVVFAANVAIVVYLTMVLLRKRREIGLEVSACAAPREGGE
jgi:uncharacterized membrane protein (DUF2068 family)